MHGTGVGSLRVPSVDAIDYSQQWSLRDECQTHGNFDGRIENIEKIEQKPLTLFKDVLFSPLHVDDLSKVIIRAIEKKVSGLFNASSKDWMSKYNFGLIMADVFRMPIDNIIETSSDEFLLKAKRPKNMILSNKKLSKLIGYDFPTIRDAINLMEKQYRNY